MAKKRPSDRPDAASRTSETPDQRDAEATSSPSTASASTASASTASASTRRYTLLVQRQDALEKPETRRAESVEVECEPQVSVLGALLAARESAAADPKAGNIAYEGDCFEGVCGACAMLINGKVALACSVSIARAADKQGRVRLAPMQSFPLVRDLVVDRSRISRTLTLVPFDGPRVPDSNLQVPSASATEALEQARLDQCHQCGACLEACPQYGVHSEFVGAVTLHEVHRLNRTPGGHHQKAERLEAMMAPGGINSCGKAQNCVEVCPAALPLVDSIQGVARATSKHLLWGWLLH